MGPYNLFIVLEENDKNGPLFFRVGLKLSLKYALDNFCPLNLPKVNTVSLRQIFNNLYSIYLMEIV
uniref:Putative ovule protein n=1 Tax=Solanum chacoense TaxID=4108 RepID=A0A0V0H329_SOLCH